MNKEWSLDVLYKGFHDENYKSDYKEYEKLTEEIIEFSESLRENADEEKALLEAINYLEEFELLESKLASFASLKQAVNTADSEAVNEITAIERQSSKSIKARSIIKKFIAGIDDIEKYIERHTKLENYEYFIGQVKKEANYLLSDEVEDVIGKLNLSAGSAWSSMHGFLTSTLEVEYGDKVITLPEVRNLAYSSDPEVRKKAYKAELAAYDNVKDAISYALNSIKSQVNTLVELRGYESPLDMTLRQSNMKKETLDAMFKAIKEYLPVFQKYLKHKAKLLGHENGLPWYDLFAPIGETSTEFSIEETKEYLVNHFRGFADDLADMVEEAFDDSWIDFYPKRGKVGRAFCSNLPFVKQSRILTNFTGSLSDVVTLAHELGHAYHGLHIQDHQPLNVDYSMPVAETASGFNESLIMEAAIKESSGEEKIALMESQLQDITQIICDIYSRYLFESEVFEKSKKGFLFADELESMMIKAQKEAYGDGLDHNYLHPYMWINKGHYYSETLSFYNFPYAFGGLFARGLFEKYKEEGEEFVEKYRVLLNATTIMDVEDAAREAEIDLEEPEFWRSSLETIANLVEEFCKESELE